MHKLLSSTQIKDINPTKLQSLYTADLSQGNVTLHTLKTVIINENLKRFLIKVCASSALATSLIRSHLSRENHTTALKFIDKIIKLKNLPPKENSLKFPENTIPPEEIFNLLKNEELDIDLTGIEKLKTMLSAALQGQMGFRLSHQVRTYLDCHLTEESFQKCQAFLKGIDPVKFPHIAYLALASRLDAIKTDLAELEKTAPISDNVAVQRISRFTIKTSPENFKKTVEQMMIGLGLKVIEATNEDAGFLGVTLEGAPNPEHGTIRFTIEAPIEGLYPQNSLFDANDANEFIGNGGTGVQIVEMPVGDINKASEIYQKRGADIVRNVTIGAHQYVEMRLYPTMSSLSTKKEDQFALQKHNVYIRLVSESTQQDPLPAYHQISAQNTDILPFGLGIRDLINIDPGLITRSKGRLTDQLGKPLPSALEIALSTPEKLETPLIDMSDHNVGNFIDMTEVADAMRLVFGFKVFDMFPFLWIQSERTTFESMVLANPTDNVLMPINGLPANQEKTNTELKTDFDQIAKFIGFRGSNDGGAGGGLQHMALRMVGKTHDDYAGPLTKAREILLSTTNYNQALKEKVFLLRKEAELAIQKTQYADAATLNALATTLENLQVPTIPLMPKPHESYYQALSAKFKALFRLAITKNVADQKITQSNADDLISKLDEAIDKSMKTAMETGTLLDANFNGDHRGFLHQVFTAPLYASSEKQFTVFFEYITRICLTEVGEILKTYEYGCGNFGLGNFRELVEAIDRIIAETNQAQKSQSANSKEIRGYDAANHQFVTIQTDS
jgi:hypothetical protein